MAQIHRIKLEWKNSGKVIWEKESRIKIIDYDELLLTSGTPPILTVNFLGKWADTKLVHE